MRPPLLFITPRWGVVFPHSSTSRGQGRSSPQATAFELNHLGATSMKILRQRSQATALSAVKLRRHPWHATTTCNKNVHLSQKSFRKLGWDSGRHEGKPLRENPVLGSLCGGARWETSRKKLLRDHVKLTLQRCAKSSLVWRRSWVCSNDVKRYRQP